MTHLRLGVCLPVYNETQSISATLAELLEVISGLTQISEIQLVIVDDASRDGSNEAVLRFWRGLNLKKPQVTLHLLTLARNLGHQKAILCALRHLGSLPVDFCLIMDADGQDDPAAIAAMVEQAKGADIVFAHRSRRAEGWLWVAAYHAYQALSRLLLGTSLYFGNYCLISSEVAREVAGLGDLSHLAATLSTLPYSHASVSVARRRRRGGQTKMNYAKLLEYGVAAMTASNQRWINLFSRLSLVMAVVSALGVASVILIRLFTHLAITGWASVMSMLAFIISFQSLGFLVILSTLRQLTSKVSPVVTPCRKEELPIAGLAPGDTPQKKAG